MNASPSPHAHHKLHLSVQIEVGRLNTLLITAYDVNRKIRQWMEIYGNHIEKYIQIGLRLIMS